MSKTEINNNLYHSAVACCEVAMARKKWNCSKKLIVIIRRLNELYDKSIAGR